MKALFELFRRFDARRIFGFIRRLGGMSCPKVKCYDLRSTRALRVEGDIKGFRKKVIVYQISIHAFRMEGDVLMFCRLVSSILFLSTPSGWRATRMGRKPKTLRVYFYPRPPGGGRRCCRLRQPTRTNFYPRPPGGGRLQRKRILCKIRYFYPRPPGGGRRNARRRAISAWYFYPRPPGGG